MINFIENSLYFGLVLTFLSYSFGTYLKKKTRCSFFNPILISVVCCILVLFVFKIDYKIYYSSAKYLSYLLTPATICLAIPLYEQFSLLKQNFAAIITGIISGVATSLCTIFVMCYLLSMSHKDYISLLPKSITTAIGMGVSEELGGYVSITVAVIIITGILGNVIGEFVLRLFKIREPIAKGIAMGTSSHAIGTAKAIEFGEIEGAMSSLSIVISGLITVAGASLFSKIL